jgi:CheY-like chemotaxis protein
VPRILLIEDHPDLLLVTSQWLTVCGFDVTGVPTGADALHSVDMCSFDVILCDISLPDMTGLELVRLIRRTCDTPAIAFTSHRHFHDAIGDIASQFVAHIRKPVDPVELEATIRAVL